MRTIKTPEERKADMVAIASVLFARQGFVRTSVAEITDQAQVAKGLFYYYFSTKDEMVKSVVEGYSAYLGEVAAEIADGPGSGRDKLARFFSGDEWKKKFTQPMIEDLRLPQSTDVYCDMCDRMTEHLSPALIRIVTQMFEEAGEDTEMVPKIVRTGLYGTLMMLRRGEMTAEDALTMLDMMLRQNALAA